MAFQREVSHTLPAGLFIHIDGVPVVLVNDTEVNIDSLNIPNLKEKVATATGKAIPAPADLATEVASMKAMMADLTANMATQLAAIKSASAPLNTTHQVRSNKRQPEEAAAGL